MALEHLYEQIMHNIPHTEPHELEAVYRVIQAEPEAHQEQLVSMLGLDGVSSTINKGSKYQ